MAGGERMSDIIRILACIATGILIRLLYEKYKGGE